MSVGLFTTEIYANWVRKEELEKYDMKLKELGFIAQLEKPPDKYEKLRKKIKARDRRLGINDLADMSSLLNNTKI
jgi:hypothetical protein